MRIAILATGLVLLSTAMIQPLAAQRSRAAKDDPNRLVCRTTIKTGTLAGRERQCFTAAEWERLADSGSRGARDTVDRLRGGFRCGSIPTGAGSPPNPSC